MKMGGGRGLWVVPSQRWSPLTPIRTTISQVTLYSCDLKIDSV